MSEANKEKVYVLRSKTYPFYLVKKLLRNLKARKKKNASERARPEQ